MDRGLHPGLWHVVPRAAPLSIDSLMARVRAAVPKPSITGITMPPVSDRAYLMQAGATQVFVDPYTGVVLGTRTIEEWNRTLPRRLHVLHVSLMASKIGGEIVGIITISSLVLVLTGDNHLVARQALARPMVGVVETHSVRPPSHARRVRGGDSRRHRDERLVHSLSRFEFPDVQARSNAAAAAAAPAGCGRRRRDRSPRTPSIASRSRLCPGRASCS